MSSSFRRGGRTSRPEVALSWVSSRVPMSGMRCRLGINDGCAYRHAAESPGERQPPPSSFTQPQTIAPPRGDRGRLTAGIPKPRRGKNRKRMARKER